ncbi:MAG: hypothetical protein K2N38_01850 [Oscillospiraceae bacterium]|nr:hypothetical protein [Oscillospiraceae bacterium]
MTISGTYDLSKRFDNMAETINTLIKARDAAYSQIEAINNNEDLTPEGKQKRVDEIHNAYAEGKKEALIQLHYAINDICEWDNGNAELDLKNEQFKEAMQIASYVGGSVTPELVNSLMKNCTNRIQLECLYTILKDKYRAPANFTEIASCPDPFRAIESKLYNPVELYENTKTKVYEYLKDNDFMLHKLIGCIRGMRDKIVINVDRPNMICFNITEPKIDMQAEINAGMGLQGAGVKGGYSPIKAAYINGVLT